MKVIHWHALVNGRPWGHGAEGIRAATQACSRCGQHPKVKEATMHSYRDGRIMLCTPCARRKVDEAFHRDLTPTEAQAVYLGFASCISIVDDDLAVLFTKSR